MTRFAVSTLLAALAATPSLADGAPTNAAQAPEAMAPDALPALKAGQFNEIDAARQENPWAGLTIGTEVMGVSGVGKGARGGFGGGTFIGYDKVLDNGFVLGVRGSAGYTPSPFAYGPRGYGFGMAEAKLGYDMGRFQPYAIVGLGEMRATNFTGGATGLNSINNVLAATGPSTTVTEVGAGFTYEITNNLRVGVEVSTVQAHGGFGPRIPPQPGGLP